MRFSSQVPSGSTQPSSSVSTVRWPRRRSSASTVLLPVPDIPVTSTRATTGTLEQDAGMPLFTGVGVALVTLFHPDGTLDAPATGELAARLAELGVGCILVAGTTGEAA